MGADPDGDAFGEAVRGRRLARGLSQERLAERAGVSVEHVARVERGEKSPSLRVARSLAAALDVPLADLLTEAP